MIRDWARNLSTNTWDRIKFSVIGTGAAYASAYDIKTSLSGTLWNTVYETDERSGGTEVINLEPVHTRYIRIYGRRRGTKWGYSIWDLFVHPAE